MIFIVKPTPTRNTIPVPEIRKSPACLSETLFGENLKPSDPENSFRHSTNIKHRLYVHVCRPELFDNVVDTSDI